jgi:hypothetical protein
LLLADVAVGYNVRPDNSQFDDGILPTASKYTPGGSVGVEYAVVRGLVVVKM